MTKRRTIIAALGSLGAAAAAVYTIGLFAELERVLLFAGLYLVWFFLYAILFAAVETFVSISSIRIMAAGLLTAASTPMVMWFGHSFFFGAVMLPSVLRPFLGEETSDVGFSAPFDWLGLSSWVLLCFAGGLGLGVATEMARRLRRRRAPAA